MLTDIDYREQVNTSELFVKRLTETAQLPTRGSKGAAGYDLYSDQEIMLYPHQRGLINTGIAIRIPKGYYGRIAPRSGLAVKSGIDVLAGVIDEDYRGEIKILLYNTNIVLDRHVFINKGDRIAQLILEKIITPDVVEVNDLDFTYRGDNGFGSTGA